jgi:hypothetical protein
MNLNMRTGSWTDLIDIAPVLQKPGAEGLVVRDDVLFLQIDKLVVLDYERTDPLGKFVLERTPSLEHL